MKKTILLIINLVLLNYCFGQSTNLKGEVKDFATGEPLPYATIQIFSLKTGTIANKNGNFHFEVNSNNLTQDTINFSYVGYETTKMSVDGFLKSGRTIKLKAKTIELNEVKVIPKKYSIKTVGIKDKSPLSMQYSNIFGTNKGNFIKKKILRDGLSRSVIIFTLTDFQMLRLELEFIR